VSGPLVIAHRGASAEQPENSLAAFARAIELEADFVELDVHADALGELVVSHDPPSPRRPPLRLVEALDLCSGRIGVMAELKTPYRYRRHRPVERLLALLDSDDVVVCFEPGALAEARSLRPALRRLQHLASVSARRAADDGAWAVGFEDAHVSASGLGAATRLGLLSAVYTVNDARRMAELASSGVAALFTDDPRLALAALRPPAGA
jgi:glycerophosphoryl diester phosphodiesterase